MNSRHDIDVIDANWYIGNEIAIRELLREHFDLDEIEASGIWRGIDALKAKCLAIAARDEQDGLLCEQNNGIENTILDVFEKAYEEYENERSF